MSSKLIGVCAIVAACLVPAARVQGGACIAFFDKAEFEAFNAGEGKFLKGIEDFEESNIPPGAKQPLPAPLAGSIPNVDPATGWGFPTGLLQKNLIILDNITQGPNPPRTHPSGSDIALYVIGPGFLGSNSVKVGEDLFLKGIHASLDLLFTEPNHTGIGFELSRFPGFPVAGWHITVYDKADVELGKFFVPPPPAPEPDKSFFGIWCFETIGRINIYDEAGPSPDAIDNVQMWVDEPFNPPSCPWDCGLPHNKIVDVVDLLKLLAEYDPGAPNVCDGGACDFDGKGCVDVVDLLKLLGQWNLVCPAPVNDECQGSIPIIRVIDDERILEHFDMYGATPSPDPYGCLAPPQVLDDIWYCLVNASGQPKHVTLRTDVQLFLEVHDGCFCPPGPLLVCGPDTVKFLMFPGQQVTIRLINAFDLPNDALKGTLYVINNPIPPDSRLCPPDSNYSQVPHQPFETWIFGGSDKQPALKRYEDFAHDGRFIEQLVFWGADVFFEPETGFVECNLQSPFFNINFYQDDGTGHPLKSDPICTYFVQAEKAFLDFYDAGFIVNAWRYTVDLNPQCRLPAGKFWVSIQGAGGGGPNDPNECWFYWLSSPQFNNPGSVLEFTATGEQIDETFDLSLCILGKVPQPSVRCGQCAAGPHWIDVCPGGNDVIAPNDHAAVVGIDVNLDCIPDVNLTLFGADNLLIQKEGKYDDSLFFPGLRPIDGHLDVMDTTIMSMTLTGGGVTLRVGKNQGGVIFPTHGAIAESFADPTIGESFFDVFFEVDLGGGQFAYNQQAVTVAADITCVPPRANYRHQPGCTPLYTSPVPGQGFHVANLINANHFVFEPPPNPFGCPQPGSCCKPHGNPGCDDTSCCRSVCEFDPFCCQVQWDLVCVNDAQLFPQCGCALRVIPPGDDCFSTFCGPTHVTLDLPGGFFGPGCDPFSGVVQLQGQTGFIDTVVRRLDSMIFDHANLPQTEVIPIELVQLNLVSCSPITVTCPGGSQFWQIDVHVEPPQPTGSMTVTKTTPQGGTFTSTFFVQPLFTFIRVDAPGVIPDVPGPPIQLDAVDVPWLTGVPVPGFLCSPDFAPGWTLDDQGQPCCVETCHENPSGEHQHCTVPPQCQHQCPPVPAAVPAVLPR